MGSLPGLLGVGSGVGDTGMPEPIAAPINNPVSMNDISDSYKANQSALAEQRNLLSALQNQNGIGNQSNVYNQFQGVAGGTGPNPAKEMLSQSTGQNVANQAALMAGQRGASSNVGMMARQAAQQGANTQQQAAGQSAVMQAQQSLNALNSAGNIANTQVANQIGATNAQTAANQNQYNSLLGFQGDVNKIAAQQQGNINNIYGQLANTTMQGQQGMTGGIMKSMGTMGGMMMGGGMGMAEGGEAGQGAPVLDAQQAVVQATPSKVPSFSELLKKPKGKPKKEQAQVTPQVASTGPGALYEGSSAMGDAVFGSLVKKPGGNKGMSDNTSSRDIQNMPVMPAANGGYTSDYRDGGKVNAKNKNQKATAKGNSYANDKIPAVLSEHEIVLPRTVTLSEDPIGEAAKFVAAVIAKRRAKK